MAASESITQINYSEFEIFIDVPSAQWFNLVNPNKSSILEYKCPKSFKKQCKIDQTLGQNVVPDMRFSRIFKHLFHRINLRGCYRAQNMKSMTQAASKEFSLKNVLLKVSSKKNP